MSIKTEAAKFLFKVWRGVWGDNPLDTKRQTIDATDSVGAADVYSRLGKDGEPQVVSMQVEAQQPIELGSTVTVDSITEHLDLTDVENTYLSGKFGQEQIEMNTLSNDEGFVNMLRDRDIDLVITREPFKHMERLDPTLPSRTITEKKEGFNFSTGEARPITYEENMDTVYRIIDKNSIKNVARISPFHVDSNGFYSPARRLIERSKQARMPGKEWLDLLKSKEAKLDAEDMGLTAFLRTKQSISQREVIEYINENQIQLETVSRVGLADDAVSGEIDFSDYGPTHDQPLIAEEIGIMRDDEFYMLERHQNIDDFKRWLDENNLIDEFPSDTDEIDRLVELHGDDFAQAEAEAIYDANPYIQADSDGYRVFGREGEYELFDPNGHPVDVYSDIGNAERAAQIHALDTGHFASSDADHVNPEYAENWAIPGGTNPKETLLIYEPPPNEVGNRYRFTHGHFPEDDNYLIHARTDERDVGGVWTNFIQEIQSDWQQTGQGGGYMAPGRWHVGMAHEGDIRWSSSGSGALRVYLFDDEGNQFGDLYGFDSFSAAEEVAEQQGASEVVVVDQLFDERGKKKLVPEAPFKDNWGSVGFSKILYDTIMGNGFERTPQRIAWTPGVIQLDRYSGARLEEVDIKRVADYTVERTSPHQQRDLTVDKRMFDVATIDIFGASRLVTQVPAGSLHTVVGRQLAREVLSEEYPLNDLGFSETKTYRHLGGVSPMQGLVVEYDSTLLSAANRILKPYGVQPKFVFPRSLRADHMYLRQGMVAENVPHTNEQDSAAIALHSKLYMNVTDEQKRLIDKKLKSGVFEMQTRTDTPEGVPIVYPKEGLWQFDITPEMHKDISRNGVPMASAVGLGALEFEAEDPADSVNMERLAYAESTNDPTKVGAAGELGHIQMTPTTYADIKKAAGRHGIQFPKELEGVSLKDAAAKPELLELAGRTHLRIVAHRLKDKGIPVTTRNLVIAWNMGVQGYKNRLDSGDPLPSATIQLLENYGFDVSDLQVE